MCSVEATVKFHPESSTGWVVSSPENLRKSLFRQSKILIYLCWISASHFERRALALTTKWSRVCYEPGRNFQVRYSE